jgi:hypothetical protein
MSFFKNYVKKNINKILIDCNTNAHVLGSTLRVLQIKLNNNNNIEYKCCTQILYYKRFIYNSKFKFKFFQFHIVLSIYNNNPNIINLC